MPGTMGECVFRIGAILFGIVLPLGYFALIIMLIR